MSQAEEKSSRMRSVLLMLLGVVILALFFVVLLAGPRLLSVLTGDGAITTRDGCDPWLARARVCPG